MNTPTAEQIVEDFEFFDDWEQRYQYLIDLGKSIPAMDDAQKTDKMRVHGCQSKVWLNYQLNNGVLSFQVDSDALIVKGLLMLVMAAYNQKTPEQILAFDIDTYFKRLDLERHITPNRGNGLRSIVATIQKIAHDEIA
jgi:cysteine desulfuration protein SufE